MLYLKSYCYSKHELPFIITQLEESKEYVDKVCIYEYNYTHTGKKKEYEIEKVLHKIPKNLIEKLNAEINFRRVENVGPKVSSELLNQV